MFEVYLDKFYTTFSFICSFVQQNKARFYFVKNWHKTVNTLFTQDNHNFETEGPTLPTEAKLVSFFSINIIPHLL